MEYLDYSLNKGEYNTAAEFSDEDAVILAIKNILLSRPGNFPFNPSIGMNIKKYQFEFLDDSTLSDIRNELERNIGELIPSIGNVTIDIRKIEDENGQNYLCISIGSNINGVPTEANFVLSKKNEDIFIYNEIFSKK